MSSLVFPLGAIIKHVRMPLFYKIIEVNTKVEVYRVSNALDWYQSVFPAAWVEKYFVESSQEEFDMYKMAE